jgi:hypothetical protein
VDTNVSAINGEFRRLTPGEIGSTVKAARAERGVREIGPAPKAVVVE